MTEYVPNASPMEQTDRDEARHLRSVVRRLETENEGLRDEIEELLDTIAEYRVRCGELHI